VSPRFRDRFFDLSEFPITEVKPPPDQYWEWLGHPRYLTCVRWDEEIDFVIEVGEYCDKFALDELHRQMLAEYSALSAAKDT
jgi:hypothetical protein